MWCRGKQLPWHNFGQEEDRKKKWNNKCHHARQCGLIWSDWDSRAEEAASKSDIARLGRNLDQQLQQQQDEDDDDESPSGMMVLREED